MSIGDYLKFYAERDVVRLHTPGHKGKRDGRDITELTDGSFPSAQVREAEKYIAGVYGASHARLLPCGSSQGVKAAILYADGDGIIDKNSHRSVFDGFRLARKNYTAVGDSDVRPITLADIKKAATKDVKTVVVTSPTYFGYVADLPAISEFCASRGIRLIVDGAHGAHFGFSKRLPQAFSRYCDICNLSAHKTLSALTQGAILLDNLGESEAGKLDECVDLMGTTSPSYILLSSIEDAVIEAASEETAKAYDALFPAIEELRRRHGFLANDDFTRCVLPCKRPGKLNRELAARGVMSELVTGKYIVFLFTAADGPDSVENLSRALVEAGA